MNLPHIARAALALPLMFASVPAQAATYDVNIVFPGYVFSFTDAVGTSFQQLRNVQSTLNGTITTNGLGFVATPGLSTPDGSPGVSISALILTVKTSDGALNKDFEFDVSLDQIAASGLVAEPNSLGILQGSIDQNTNLLVNGGRLDASADRIFTFPIETLVFSAFSDGDSVNMALLVDSVSDFGDPETQAITSFNFGGFIGQNFSFINNGSAFRLVDNPVTAIPLPAALPLLATGIAALGALGWRRRRAG